MDEIHSSADRAQSSSNNFSKVDERSEFERLDDQESQDILDDRKNHEEWASRLKLSPSDLAVFTRHGFHYEEVPPANTQARRDMLAYLKKAEVAPSKWLLISGLYPNFIYTEVERRTRLRALYKALLLLIRRALARKDADAFKSERSVYWDPVGEVCRDLEIAQSKLSSFCKEFSGHSLSQVVDCVRAERAMKQLRAGMRTFVSQWKTQRATLAVKSTDKIDAWMVWNDLRKSRRWPEFSQNSWALEYGFSTYRRMYRACIAVYGKTPHQLEMGMIVEFLKEPEDIRNSEIIEEEKTLLDLEKLLKEIQMYAETSG